MSLWILLLVLALIKVPLAALMLWLPFRSDDAWSLSRAEPPSAVTSDEDDDGGSKTPPGPSHDPRPRHSPPLDPRRDPHGAKQSRARARARDMANRDNRAPTR